MPTAVDNDIIIRITGDGSGYQKAIKQADAQTAAAAKNIEANAAKAEQATSKLGAGLKSALAFAGVSLTLPALIGLTKTIMEAVGAITGMNAMMERTKKLAEELLELRRRETAEILQQVSRTGNIEEQLQRANIEWEAQAAQVAGVQRRIEALRAEQERLRRSGIVNAAAQANLTNQISDSNAELERLNPLLRETRNRVNQLTREMNVAPERRFEQATQDAERLRQELEDAANGVTAFDRRMQELFDAGVPLETLVQIMQQFEMNEAAAAQRRITEQTQNLTQSLQQQVDTFGMSARAASIYQAAMNGATAAELQALEALDATLNARERDAELMRQAQAESDAMTARAEALTDQFRTPMERVADLRAELDELFEFGLIGAETYERALADVMRQTEKVAASTNSARDATSRFGAEANSRIEEYQETLRRLRVPQGLVIPGAEQGGANQPARRQGAAPAVPAVPAVPQPAQPAQVPANQPQPNQPIAVHVQLPPVRPANNKEIVDELKRANGYLRIIASTGVSGIPANLS